SSVAENIILQVKADLICFYSRRLVSTDKLLCYKGIILHYMQADDGWKLAFIMESINPRVLHHRALFVYFSFLSNK
ncbi:hypothetical protein STEG23_026071, partial [Scotinomys teguina]